MLCHAFVLPTVLTSQLRPSQPQQNQAPAPSSISVQSESGSEDTATEHLVQKMVQESNDQDLGPERPAINVPLGRNEVLIRADQQEKNQDIYNVKGHVVIRFGGNTLHSDEASYDSTTGILNAKGHVVFDSTAHNAHLVGTSATYDVSRDTGKFYDVTGSTGMRVKNKTMFLTSSTPFFFTGKVVDKLGPGRIPRSPWIRNVVRVAEAEVEAGNRRPPTSKSAMRPCCTMRRCAWEESPSSTSRLSSIRSTTWDARAGS